MIIGTLTYTTSQDWNLVDGFYFAVATLTTSSIADPNLTITGWPIKIFTVFYILVGIGILVELVRQIGFAYVEVRRIEKAEASVAVYEWIPPLHGASRISPHVVASR